MVVEAGPRGRANSQVTPSELKALVDQIRREVTESLRRELKLKTLAPEVEISAELNLMADQRAEKAVAEKLEQAKAQADAARAAAEASRSRDPFVQSTSSDARTAKYRLRVFDDRHGSAVGWKSGVSDQTFEQRTQELLATYGQYDETKRDKFVEQLTKLVSEHFNFKQSIRDAELKQLEAQLKKLRDLQVQRTKAKDEIIQERVRQLMREASGLGWGATDGVVSERKEEIVIEHEGVPR